MKTRNGFVSNSSTSSFIIAAKDTSKYSTTSCKCCGFKPVDFLTIISAVFGSRDNLTHNTVAEAKKTIREKIQEIKENIKWIEKKKECYEKILKCSEEVKTAFAEVDEAMTWGKMQEGDLATRRYCNPMSQKRKWPDGLKCIERDLELFRQPCLEKDLKKEEEKLAKLDNIFDDWVVYSIKLDSMTDSQSRDIIMNFVNAKQAVLIEEVTT